MTSKMVETQAKTQNGIATKDDVVDKAIEDAEVKLSVIEILAWRGLRAQVELLNMKIESEEKKLFDLIETEHKLPKGSLTKGDVYTLDSSQESWVLKKK